MSQTGLLLITDITGYSKYVNQSELEHAQSSLTDLLENAQAAVLAAESRIEEFAKTKSE